MKPFIVCHMIVSLDGRILPSRWTGSPDGDRESWSAAYAAIHEKLAVQGWIVGRITMAEMTSVAANPPTSFAPPERPQHFATRSAAAYAIALAPLGRLHFDSGEIGGDAVVVLLGADVSDAHLAELAAAGVSYIVSAPPQIDLALALDALARELGLKRLALEGGGAINAAFFAAGLVDEVSLLIAPTLDGAADSPALVDSGAVGLAGTTRLSLTGCERLDNGLAHLRYAALPG